MIKFNTIQRTVCLLLISLFSLHTGAAIQNDSWRTERSTQGTDFWVTFMKNAGNEIDDKSLSLQLRITTIEEEASGTIYFNSSSYRYSFRVKKGEVYTFTVPEDMRKYAYAMTEQKKEYKGVHVTSDKPISVYACNYGAYSYDATMVLPTPALGREYVVQTFSKDRNATEFAVVATASGTTYLYITPSAETTKNDPANQTLSRVALSQGQIYFVRSKLATSDLSGSRIYTTQPVAVFAGNQAAIIPASNPSLSDDHLFEQVIPLRYWGQEFAVTTAEQYKYNIARVTAIYEDTKVYLNGQLKKTLQFGESYETRVNSSAWITTSRPATCYSYFTSGGMNDWQAVLDENGDETDEQFQYGDPSMVYIAPMEQGLDSMVISAFAIVDPDTVKEAERKKVPMLHYVNIVTKTSAVSTMTLNGQSYASMFKPLEGNSAYSYARIPIVDTISYWLHNTQSSFTAYVYGLGSAESYAYNAGFNNRYNDFYLLAGGGGIGGGGGAGGGGGGAGGGSGSGGGTGGGRAFDRLSNMTICVSEDSIEFRLVPIADGMISRWDFGDGNRKVTSDSIVKHKYSTVGVYEAGVEIEYESLAWPGNKLTEKIYILVNVVDTYHNVKEEGVCRGDKVSFAGKLIDTKDFEPHKIYTYVDSAYNVAGCDSITTLKLYIGVPDTAIYETTVCPTDLPYSDTLFQKIPELQNLVADSVYVHTLKCANSNCDSTIIFHLHVRPQVDLVLVDTICQASPYVLAPEVGQQIYRNDTLLDSISTHVPGTFEYTLSNGCDSTWNFSLLVTPIYNYYDSLLRVCDNDTISWQRRLYVGHKFAEPIDNQLYDSIVRLGNETYFDTIHYQTNIFGCDSIHYLRLQIQSTDTIFQTAELCATDSLIFDSVTYYFDSIQTDTVIIFNTAKMSSLGCDSIVQLTASVHPIYTFVEYDTVFQYDPYVWLTHEGHDYYIDDKKYRDIPTTVAGEFLITDYLQSQYGCDSTHYLHLFVAPTYQFDTTMYICDNDTISWHNILYIGDHFTDSVIASDYDTIVEVSKGTIIDSLMHKTIYGSDSLYTLSLVVRNTSYVIDSVSICSDTPYTFADSTYTFADWTKDSTILLTGLFETKYGCDSLVDLYLTVHPLYSIVEYDTVFQYKPYVWQTHEGHIYDIDGKKYSEISTKVPGDYLVIDYLSSQYGCDSTHYLHLFVAPSFEYHTDMEICDNDTVSWQNRLYVGAKFTDSIAADLYDTIIPVDTMALVDSLLFQTVHGSDSLFVLSLTMHETRYVIDSITICDNEPFMFADSLYDFSDWHKDTTIMLTGLFETQFGCDSLVDLYLTIHQTYLFVEDTTICSNEPLTWRNFKDVNYWPSGTYYDTLKTVYGCDSVFQLNLNALPSFYNVVEMELCYNDTVDFQGQKVYYDQALDKDNQQHYYECRYSRQNGCDSVFRFIPIWLPAYHFYDTAVICQLDTVDWRGRRLTEPGIYTDSLLTQLGCDSIYQMFIGMDSTYLFIESDTICVGQSYEWRDSIYTFTDVEAGWYYQYERLQTQSGFCDSTYQLNLYVAPIYHFVEYDTVCESSLPYMWHEQAITDTIIHWDSLHTTLGYDSIYELQLHILPSQFMQQRIDICENDSFVYSQNVVYQAGVYIDSLVNVDGCDSIIEYTVVVHPNYHVIEKEAVCVGSDFTWHQYSFTDLASGKYEIRDTLTSVWGCDSVVTLQLLVAPTYHFIDTVTIAPGESFVFRGDTIDYAGFYHDSLTTTLGCDSIYSAYVTFLKVSYDTICTSERFDFNGQTLLETGVYYDSLKTVNGFDSVYIQHLQVNPRYRFITQDTICVGDVYEFRGKYYDEAGVYNDSLISSGGCDSIYQLHLIVHPAGTREVYDEYCNSEVYVFLGDSIDLSQFTSDTTLILYETIHNTVKCDSTIIYHVKVNPTYHFSFSDTVAINEPYTWLGHEGHRLYQGANQYTTIPTDQLGWITLNDSLHSIHGCDSIWTLNLYVAPTYLDIAADTTCYDDLPYLWRGRELYETGIYNDTLMSQYLTDSVMQMQLYVRPQDYTIEDVHICYGDSFALSNRFVSTTGVYLDTLLNQYGCDSIVEYRLTVREHYHFVSREIICEGDDYLWRAHQFIDYPSGIYEVSDTLLSTYGCDSILTLQLVVATKHHVKDTATICPGETYDFRGQLLTEAGWYHDTLYTTLGCDSIFSLHLSYLCTYYDTICQSETFEFHGRTLHETGVYYDSLLSVNGFDSVYIQYLQVNPYYSFVTFDTICRGDVYEFRGQYYTEPGVYNNSLISSGGCDSIYQLHLVVHPSGRRDIYDAYCNSEVYVFMNDTIDLSPYTDTTLIFHDTIHTTAKCDSIVTYHVQVYPTYHFSFSDTVAINEPYTWLGHEGHRLYQGANQYTTIPTDQLGWIALNDSLHSIHGCDSVWTLNLYVAPTYLDIAADTTCYDDLPYLWRGRELYETGIYNDTLMSQYLTDSVYQMNLYVRPQDYTKMHVDMCEGDTFHLSHASIFASGVYWDTIANIFGCDSVVEYTVDYHPNYHVIEKEVICAGEEFVWHGQSFATYASGLYELTDSLTGIYGCDSVVTLRLTVAPHHHIADTATMRPGETYNFRGRTLHHAGVYYDTLQTTLGCDSVFSLHLSYLSVSYDTICQSEQFNFRGQWCHVTGVYYDSLQTFNGYDSVYIEYLQVMPNYRFVTEDTICRGEVYEFRGQYYTEPGVYNDSLLAVGGCDSIYQLRLVVHPSGTREIFEEYCNNDVYIFLTDTIDLSQFTTDTTLIFHETIHNSIKCDSTVIYHVTVHPTYHFVHNDTVGQYESYIWSGHKGHTLYQGEHKFTTIPTDQLGWISMTDSLRTIHGCDSIWTLNLYVAPTYLDIAADTTCYDDLPYLWRGRELYETGIYNDTLMSQYLTDSVMQMQLYVRPQDYTIEDVHICYGDSFALSNRFVSTTGVYLDTLLNQHGCDSIVEYRLTVREHYHFVSREIICENDTFEWRGHQFANYGSGIYEVTDSLISSWGCDSIYTLQLVVATRHHVLDSATICPGETYDFRGQLLTEAGLYHDTLQTTLGCDSIFSLHLSYLCASYDTICQSERFNFRGEWYHITGVYYDSLKSVNGYDSVFVEYLQVMPNYRFVTEDTICRGEVYEFRGQYYTEPGVYNDSLLAVGGCDSIYQLRLVVHPSGTREIFEEYCNNNVYIFLTDTIDLSQFTTDTTLIFHETIHNSIKCDSTVIYHVTVHPTYYFVHNDTVGQYESYIWSGHKGHTLYQGDHKFTTIPTDQLGWISVTDSLRTIHGCDSIWTLNLYVAPTYLDIAADTTCYDDLPYLWRGRELYETGIYNDTLMSQYLTDSVYQMNLYVRPQDYTVLRIDLCEGDTYQTANAVVSQQGVYRDTLLNAWGCDSIVEHQVYVHSHYLFTEQAFICESEDFVWREHKFASYNSGIYVVTDSLVSSWGCDSVYTLRIVIAPTYQYTEVAAICPGESYAFRGREFTAAGVYSDSLHTTIGCDSIFTLRLSYFCESYDTICSGSYFDFNGKHLTQTGVYVDSMKTANGMDSVWVEYLYVQPPYSRLFHDTICSSDWYEFNGRLLNETGIYYDTLLTASGCDSVEILDLYVLSSTITEIYDTICIDGQYIYHGQVLTEAGVYTDTTVNIYGCQHVEYLYLAKVESRSVHISSTEFCADDAFLNFAFVYDGQRPISYTIRFSEEAKLEGFEDLTDQVITEDQVVSVPFSCKKYEYPRPGDYTATILLSNGFCSDSVTMQEVEFRVNYPSWIMEQHWNDVISILVDSLNGGYTFSDYQWYYNGKPMYGENKPYLYVYPSLDMLGQYAVEVTRAGDGKKIMTCPIQPSFVEDYTTSYNATIVVTPTMMSKNNPNCTLYCDQAATWFLYTAEGESISQGRINEDIPISLNLPKLSASYFVVVRTDAGYVKFIKLLVQ